LNNIALICGGYNVFDDCFAITDKTLQANVTLIQHRDAAASVVLDSTTLWLTGGFSDTGGTKSTEFVQLTGTTTGPDLPLEVVFHCLVSLNETTILLIGGLYMDGFHLTYTKDTFYYNIDDKTWTVGPSLITARYSHSCALFKSAKHGNTDTVIVTGGSQGYVLLDSTEFLIFGSNSWTSGRVLFIMPRYSKGQF
jgi:hypothetical protein